MHLHWSSWWYLIPAAEFILVGGSLICGRVRRYRLARSTVTSILFPACARKNAQRMAADFPGSTTFMRVGYCGGYAWYSVRSAPGGDTVTSLGWCRSERACNRVCRRISRATSADMHRYSPAGSRPAA